MTSAYPLHWPEGWPRSKKRSSSAFKITLVQTRDGLLKEISMLGGRYVILSTNVNLRRDGLPYANQPEPIDSGVAVYFERKGKQMVFACDRWEKVKDNIRAIEKTIEAMRGIERWGASDMLERAFSAFEALPAPGQPSVRSWWQILGVSETASEAEITAAFRDKAKSSHPDGGGSHDHMAELNAARDAGLKARKSQ